MRTARRQRERAARAVSVEAALRVEDVEQREEIVLVGAAAVEEDERAGGLAVGRPLGDRHEATRSRGFGSGVSTCSSCGRRAS